MFLREGYEGLRASKDAPAEDTRSALDKLVAFYQSSGQPERAAQYRDKPRGASPPQP